MKIDLSKYKYHLLIVIIGLLCLHIVAFLLQLESQNSIYPDSQNYHESASKMFLKFTGHYYRPLLMAFITGFPYLFGSSDAGIYEWSFYVNIFCWIGTSLVLFEILKSFIDVKKAFWFAIIPFFFIGNIVLNYHLLTENIYVFFIIVVFYLLFRYYTTKEFWYLSLSLSLLFSSMLIKPGSKFLAIVIGLYFVKEIVKNYRSKSILFLYGSFLLIGIQVIGMKAQYGDFTISYIDGVTYHNYLCSKAECFKNGNEYSQINNPRAEYLFGLVFTEQKKVAKEDLKYQISHNFINLVKAYFSDVVENSKTGNACIEDCKNNNETSYFDFFKEAMYFVSKWQNRLFTILGFLLAIFYGFKSYKNVNPISFVAFFIIYIYVLSGISCGQGDRFHLVTFPFVVLLLAKFVSERVVSTLKN